MVDIPTQANSFAPGMAPSAMSADGFAPAVAMPAGGAGAASGASIGGSAAAAVAARRSPGAAMMMAAKGMRGAHDAKQRHALHAEDIPTETGVLHTADKLANLPFHAYAGLGIGAAALRHVPGRIPGIGGQVKALSEIPSAVSAVMELPANQFLTQAPVTFWDHVLHGYVDKDGNRSYANAKETGRGFAGQNPYGRKTQWAEKRLANAREKAAARGSWLEANLSAKALGLEGTWERGANVVGNFLKPVTSPIATFLAGNKATRYSEQALEHLSAAEALHDGKFAGHLGEVKTALEALKGGNGDPKAFMEAMEAARSNLGAELGLVEANTTSVQGLKDTAGNMLNKAKNLVGAGSAEEKTLSGAVKNAQGLLSKIEDAFARSHGAQKTQANLTNLGAPLKALPEALGKMKVEQHSMMFGMMGIGNVANISRIMHGRHHRGDMLQQLQTELKAAGIDPTTSSVGKLALDVTGKKNMVDGVSAVGQAGIDAAFIVPMLKSGSHGMMGGAAKAIAAPKMRGLMGLITHPMTMMLGFGALMMGPSAITKHLSPALEAFTEMKAAEIEGQSKSPEGYAMLLSAFSPKLAEYGMHSDMLKGLAEEYLKEGAKAIDVLAEIESKQPLDARIEKMEAQILARDKAAIAQRDGKMAQFDAKMDKAQISHVDRITAQRGAAKAPVSASVAANQNREAMPATMAQPAMPAPLAANVQLAEAAHAGRISDAQHRAVNA